ncbi:hypothetical protein CHS0354_029306, partial [Potamilus streckersoni]
MDVVIDIRRVILLLPFVTYFSMSARGGFYDDEEYKPKFMETPSNVTLFRGEHAILKCHIMNLGPRTVIWRKSEQDFPITIGKLVFSSEDEMAVNDYQVDEAISAWDLHIKYAQPSHSGLYQCEISATKIFAHYVSLTVIDDYVPRTPTPPGISIYGRQYVDKGRDIHLICNATGEGIAPEDVDWYFKGEKIVPTNTAWLNRATILKRKPIPGNFYISELIIKRSNRQDGGSYVCRSSDLKVSSINVHVLEEGKGNVSRR